MTGFIKLILKYTVVILVSCFVIVNLILGYFGISSVFLTAIVYVFILFVGIKVIKTFTENYVARQNYLLMFCAFIISLFLGELALKYVFKVSLERQEVNGKFFYISPYRKPQIENLIRKFRHIEMDLRLRSYLPYTSRMFVNKEFQYLHSYNALGLRGNDPSPDTFKINIVGLGDSFTEGVGAPQDSTYLRLLESKLVTTIPNIQCINGGIAGGEPFDAYITLKDFLLRFNPRIVIVAVNSTDIGDVIEKGGWERYTTVKKAPWWSYIYQFSYFSRLLIHLVCPVNFLFLSKEENEVEELKALEKIEHCLIEDYKKLAQENNFKLIVVLHPMLNELEQNKFSLQPLVDKLRVLPAIKTINLFDAFKNAKQNGGIEYNSLFWRLDGHNNSKGYQFWADILFAEVQHEIKDDSAECF